jgi:heme/copper-type cytochrome/quinol oxidase subunit 1
MAGKFAGLTAIGTALLPTSPEINPTVREIVIGHFHILFAASFFLTLAYFSLVLFRKTDSIKPPTQQKMKRNIVYTICGIGIITSVVLIVLLRFLPVNSTVLSLSPIFWLESLAIIFFGISWFVKGETILKDN